MPSFPRSRPFAVGKRLLAPASQALRATRRSREATERFEPEGHKDVLFVFDTPGAWTRYRCDHQAEQLGFLGWSCDVVRSSAVDLAAAVDHYETFVLNRVEWSDEVAAFFERLHAAGKHAVFDTDDLLFEPGLIHHLAAFDGWPEAERRLELERLDRYRETLEACTGATVTTEPLREHALRHASHVAVVHNSVSTEMVERSDRARRKGRRDEVRIAYLSGTRTHNRDFLEAADAVASALDRFPDARFLAVGKIDVGERFERFGERVEKLPMQPWQSLPRVLAQVDVNLAPLERDNPFTECKSCVKYLEAALVGVPTVASPRPDFVRALEPGRTGLLADSPAEWEEAIGRLVDSATLRQEIGRRAYEDVREAHTTRVRAPEFEQALAAFAGETSVRLP